MSMRKILTFSFLTGAVLMACGPKNVAPDCAAGQALFYSNGNYTCNYVQVTGASQFGLYNQGQFGAAGFYGQGATPAPQADCNDLILGQQHPDQQLTNINGAWRCEFKNVIHPDNADSPKPPIQRGGEFCNSPGAQGSVMSGPNGNNTIGCDTGSYCLPAAAGQPIMGNQGFGGWGGFGGFGAMGVTGQSGICTPRGF